MEQSVYEIVVRPVMRILTDHISKHLGYAACSTKHVNKMRNKMQDLENTSVSDWLNAVEKLKEEVQKIPSDNIGCLNMKTRYQAGRQACKNTATIQELTETNSGFKWTDAPKPTGIVDSKPASSTTASSSGAEVFRSRDEPFNKALKLLQIDADNSPVIALCGMGGVGKTTMMEQLLERVAKENKTFDLFVKVVIGRSPNMLSIQNDVSVQMGGEGLLEKTEAASADSLCKKFKEQLQDGKKRILVILDDVWQNINLKSIGITSPLPKGLKLLLTSRDSKFCSQIAVGVGSTIQVVKVDVLEEEEAQNLFCQIAEVSKENDEDKYLIGCDIVKACGHLPLAIKLIASTLKFEEMFEWRTARDLLKNGEFDDDVQEIIKISYDYIKRDEEKKIFLHCGLYPEDYDIPIEDLMRHAWGLKLFKKVSTLREARDRTNTCVGNLIKANLLIKSDQVGCVKLHDLVLAFVLSEVSKGDHGWIINHGDVSNWDRDEVGESCKRISLTCKGMSEFSSKYRYPNMSLLQLMHGDPSLIFPEDFYDKMEDLKVVAYYAMHYPLPPLPPRSLEYSTNLKSLCLHNCFLVFDLSSIGDLVNLEVLSFADSGINKLPSTIGNLKRLKLLDLTGCGNLHIDDGVFKKLKSLEELYMRVSGKQAVRFTDSSFEELMMLSSQLCAMEVEFVNKITHLKNVCFTKLDRFRISVGRLLEPKLENEKFAFKNTLNLVTNNSSDLLDCKISELFKKTENLTLEVKYMIRLEDICSFHPSDRSTFSCLSDLEVSKCENVKYLFTISMATGLKKLEKLKISSCNNLEALVHDYGSEINSGFEMIKFGDLKLMSLKGLPKLISLFLVENVVELPQLIKLEVEELPNFTSIYPHKNNISALLNNQVKIPELKELKIRSMSNLEQIWACRSDEEVNSISMLRVIEVAGCDNLVSLFPTNPIRLVKHLEELEVSECGSIEVIFNIDLESCVSEVERLSYSSLKSIEVYYLKNLREVWRIKCYENKSSCILSFDAIETISIGNCESFRKIFTSTNVKVDMHALRNLYIRGCREHGRNMELIEYRQHEETKVFSGEEDRDDNIPTVAIPSSLVHYFLNLDTLELNYYDGMEVVFEIESGLLSSTDLVTTTHNQQPLLLPPYLQTLKLSYMVSMSHVWKCSNWNKFLILQKQHTQSSFRSLTTIHLGFCDRIKYLFSPLMAKLLSNLKTIDIDWCYSMEEIVSNRDDKDEEITATYETTALFPHLHSLVLFEMKNLKRIGGDAGVRNEIKFSQVNIVSWSLCQYPREIRIHLCSELVEIFETQGITNNGGFGSHSDIDEGRAGTDTTTLAIPRLENIHVPQLSNLKKLVIYECDLLQHVFTFSTLESLKQLEELAISKCSAMEVVVKKENEEQRKVVVFPHLKSIQLRSLPNLQGFFLGMNGFEWPLLETVVIEKCPQMVVFTSGASIAPKLTYIRTELGKHILDEGGLNFDLTTESQQVPSAESTTLCSLLFKQFPACYFRNLIELIPRWDDKCHKSLISSDDVPHLQKLERILLEYFSSLEVVFEVEAKEGENSESQTILQIPNLTQLEFRRLFCLEYIWKRNHHHNNRTVWLFPNLTTMIIDQCRCLNYVISSSMVGSLQQLQHLHVSSCRQMKEVVKVEEEDLECDAKGKEIVLPCLKSLKLARLDRLEGFYLGMEGFSLPSLHNLEIMGCPNIKVFSRGHVATPALKAFDTSFGRCYVRKDINSSMEAIVKIQEEEEEEEKKKEREDEEDDEKEDEDEEDDEEEDENNDNEDRDDEEEEVHSYIETAQHESASNNQQFQEGVMELKLEP
ncbi:hypothetical protein M8C21_000046 [Ambrosia artemisiifolia]|uniref:NB-ARC domain-containing protein n=1 Tax=Ambrosia artemisiifolia TaxID=4212 RepID=A0AAD5D4G9_AMBAR|nr:hypothetical protein M8C21_000046 [Ambrosia artemisiifolia]